jgi:phosphohistidine phosphatase
MKKTPQKQLYIVRHADALPGADDAVRPLSKKGRKQSAVIGSFLKRISISVDAIWQSELLRAQQTAEIIAKKMRLKRAPETVKGLGPDDSIPALRKRLDAFKGNLMIIGHAPSLPSLIPFLLGLTERQQIVDLKKGGVACLEVDKSGKWVLLWCVEPSICE